MSEEIVFFNPGDAVANDFDFAAARRSAQIYKAEHVVDEGLVVAKDKDGKYPFFTKLPERLIQRLKVTIKQLASIRFWLIYDENGVVPYCLGAHCRWLNWRS